MEMQEYIPIEFFCRQHGIDVSFLSALQEFGLIEFMQVDDAACLPFDQLETAEKMVRLHGELEINLEGIDVVAHLLRRIETLQTEMLQLKNKLRFYEETE